MSYSEEKLSNNRLRKLLHKQFSGKAQRRSHKVVHVSMLTDRTMTKEYCPRESALCYQHDIGPGDEWISTAMRVTYDMGWFLQDAVTRRVHKYAIGDWHCPICENHWRGVGYKNCPCGAIPTYQEMHFRSKVSGVTGSIDLALDLGHEKAVIVEIKSLEKDAFKKLSMPTIEHRLRVIGYLQLLKECAILDPWIEKNLELDFGYVLYVSKGFGKYFAKKEGGVNEQYSPFQEYLVKAEGNPLKDVLEKYDRAAQYWIWRTGLGTYDNSTQILPDRIFNCGAKDCKRALACPAKEQCWAGVKI